MNAAPQLPDEYALVNELSRDDCVQVSYRSGGRSFFVILSLEEATRHALNIQTMVKQIRKRAKATERKMKGV